MKKKLVDSFHDSGSFAYLKSKNQTAFQFVDRWQASELEYSENIKNWMVLNIRKLNIHYFHFILILTTATGFLISDKQNLRNLNFIFWFEEFLSYC